MFVQREDYTLYALSDYFISVLCLFFGKLIDCGRAKLTSSSPHMIIAKTMKAQWCVNGKPIPIPYRIDQANSAPRRLGENTLEMQEECSLVLEIVIA